MRRRLVVAALLTVGALALLLDEPTAGVDVVHALEVGYAKSRGPRVARCDPRAAAGPGEPQRGLARKRRQQIITWRKSAIWRSL
ncbi:hypothetical protein Tneu_0004 [Pyrobaculum neutrophilum V24Sta]|uniref:Uncharacterized protein n=2 Tax=Pyrobaculum neutrophilum TaxID=70771 RepID=B1Y9P0_PYRNV|nr:hypothetical protein Tneu_0004 [Pyrobaculum neutrophilum V24Sta]